MSVPRGFAIRLADVSRCVDIVCPVFPRYTFPSATRRVREYAGVSCMHRSCSCAACDRTRPTSPSSVCSTSAMSSTCTLSSTYSLSFLSTRSTPGVTTSCLVAGGIPSVTFRNGITHTPLLGQYVRLSMNAAPIDPTPPAAVAGRVYSCSRSGAIKAEPPGWYSTRGLLPYTTLPPPPPPVGSSPAGGLPPQPPPPALTPPPYVRATRAPRTPKPFALVKLKPKVNIPDPLMVYIPDMPELCGTYKMQKKKHKDMPLYLSNDCETQECVIFMSHGGYWMLGKELQDAQDNRPLCKTLGKAIRAPRSKAEYPNMMGGARGGWHCNTHGKGWEDLDKDHCVETTEEMAKKNLDVTMCKKKEAGSEEAASGGSDDTMMMDMMMMMMAEGSSGGGGGSDAGMMAQGEAAAASPLVDDGTPETRKDVDGALYTFTQFKAYYKGKAQAQWDARAATSNKKVAGRLSLGQSVVAAKDITLGGSVLVPEGTEGVVMSVGKDAGTWKVRFKKEPPIAVTLEGTALKVQ
eukprot:Rhum_TRINITY_DN14575_c3_g1::Rhum_TRINITY_DN14575_c3_g1_i1::g.99195::m.99195